MENINEFPTHVRRICYVVPAQYRTIGGFVICLPYVCNLVSFDFIVPHEKVLNYFLSDPHRIWSDGFTDFFP